MRAPGDGPHGKARPGLASRGVISREAWDSGRQTPGSPKSKHGLLGPTAAAPPARGQEVSSWTSRGKQALLLPAASEAARHGSRQAAVTKLCQAQRSPADAVTQRHTPLAPCPFPGMEGGWLQPPCCLEGSLWVSAPLDPSPCRGGMQASLQGRYLPSGMPQRELGAATDEGAPQLKPDQAGARRKQKRCLSWPGNRETSF